MLVSGCMDSNIVEASATAEASLVRNGPDSYFTVLKLKVPTKNVPL